MGAELKNCEIASGPRKAILVKGKMKNQRKLINTEEATPRGKQIGSEEEKAQFLPGRPVTVLGSHRTFVYPLVYLLSPPNPTTYLPLHPFLEVA